MHGELEASLRSATEDLLWTKAELEKQTSLNEKLETDLLQINVNASARNDQSETSSVTDGLAKISIGGTKVCFKTVLNLMHEHKLSSYQDNNARSSPIPFTSSADTSILPIVTSQRDRFRQRNAELEEVCFLFSFVTFNIQPEMNEGIAEAISNNIRFTGRDQDAAI